MPTILLIIIVIILLIFLGGWLLEGLGEAIGIIAVAVTYISKGIVRLIKKLLPNKKSKKVVVFCPCSNSFKAEPKPEDGWIVRCPKCGKKLRVDTSKKKEQ